MYYFFLDKMLLPVPPDSMSLKINGSNKTVRLIDDSEINIIKNAGLSDVNFEFMVPSSPYPFTVVGEITSKLNGTALGPVVSVLGSAAMSIAATAMFSYLEKLKTKKQPFRFIVARMRGNFVLMFFTNMLVTLEDYEIKENADYGFDQMVSVRLKQYRNYSTKVLVTDKDGKATVKPTRG